MKKRFFVFASIFVLAFGLSGISCSQNGDYGIPAGNVKPGSSADPFADSEWSVYQNNSTGKILYFENGNKFVYGANYGTVGTKMTGDYTVRKEGNEYSAYCRINSYGQYVYYQFKIDEFNSSLGVLTVIGDISGTYYTLYRL